MEKIRESKERLNRLALELPGTEAAFRVHFWGIATKHYDNPVHKHSFFEVCYVWNGRGEYEELGNIYSLEQGVLFCSRPGVVHQIRSATGLSLLFVAFELDESRSSALETERYRRLAVNAEVCLRDAEDAPTIALWRSLLMTGKEHLRLSDAAVAGAAHALLHSFADVFSPRREGAAERSSRMAEALLRRAKLYIRDNLDRPITLAHVAGYLHVSERHVSRIFAEGIHESFDGYVRKARIQHAAYLLTHTDTAIKEIAERIGFGTVHSFTRAFARETGLPPGRYREKR